MVSQRGSIFDVRHFPVIRDGHGEFESLSVGADGETVSNRAVCVFLRCGTDSSRVLMHGEKFAGLFHQWDQSAFATSSFNFFTLERSG